MSWTVYVRANPGGASPTLWVCDHCARGQASRDGAEIHERICLDGPNGVEDSGTALQAWKDEITEALERARDEALIWASKVALRAGQDHARAWGERSAGHKALERVHDDILAGPAEEAP